MRVQRFLAAAMDDPALCEALAAADPDAFGGLLATAAERGLTLDAATLQAVSRPDLLGLSRWSAPLVCGAAWPPPTWLPIQVAADDGGLHVDWAYFGAGPLREPFFEDSIRRALRTPFARLSRYRMTLADFFAQAEPGLAPDGLIFHMSRCGSTLVSQMLGAMTRTIAVSEAAPIDSILQLARNAPQPSANQQADALHSIVAAYGRKRAGDERRYFLKLDSWHALSLPLFRRAFPETPWVFLYRDPVEVMVSHARQRGAQMVPDIVPPSLYGLDAGDTTDPHDYVARVLATICRAAAGHLGEGGGLAVSYRDLPEAVFTKILPHFGIAPDDDERTIMRRVTQRDAKAQHADFAADSAAKQREASTHLRTLAGRHLGAVYRELEKLSGG